MKLVIVESKAKAAKIQGFLGKEYRVEPCLGHVRDLPSGRGAPLGIDVNNQFAPTYKISKAEVVTKLRKLLPNAEAVYLATDPDREGEAIAWHLCEAIKPEVPINRIVFTEITKSAIDESLAHPRQIDVDLVKAQEVRRLSDRLIGYILSPLLFKRHAVPGSKSVGRVQSPTLRLLVDREYERRYFRSGAFWGLAVQFTAGGVAVAAELTAVNGQRIATSKDFDRDTGKLKDDAQVNLVDRVLANALVAELRASPSTVEGVTSREEERKPREPFRTVTLQQSAASQLGWNTDRIMRVAQRLYENGHITYTRTDSVSLSTEALEAARTVASQFGAEYVPGQPIIYQSSDALAQEAHEAIRPADVDWKSPSEKELPEDERKLYALIYQRTVASQMTPARVRNTAIDITCGEATFCCRTQETLFNGFRAMFDEEEEEENSEEEDHAESRSPDVHEGDEVVFVGAEPQERHTNPPARYTETRLIGRLEGEGVGRPSTYSAVVESLVQHGYARRQRRTLIPTFVGMGLIRFLESELSRYINLQYTAEMEGDLDRIATGGQDGNDLLAQLYDHLAERSEAIEENLEALRVTEVPFEDLDASIKVMISRYGPYLTSDSYPRNRNVPEGVAPADLDTATAISLLESANGEPYQIDIGTQDEVWVKFGAEGAYLELMGSVRRTATIPVDVPATEVTPEMARTLMRPTAVVGDVDIFLRSGRNWYLQWTVNGERVSRNIPSSMDPLDLEEEQILALYHMPRELGSHPETGGKVVMVWGRKGPFFRHTLDGEKAVVGFIDADADWTVLTLEDAVEALQERLESRNGK